ncbi:serine hydrolase [Algoriphagus sp.]|uniref:serine hydrolase domain-containing protein n=1 Tax=Algoriphagus sp. TaxID=1872435 RepID=UPI0025E7B126|nr:serine hydrolase [Algoriphagus sp.]
MKKKLNIFLTVLGIWFILFLFLDWWNSYPKIKVVQVKTSQLISDKIDSIVQKSITEYTLPGIGLGIVKDGKIIYQNSFGFQSLEPLDSFSINSQFPSASISKIFTAIAAAKYWSSKGIVSKDLISMIKSSSDPKSDLDQLKIENLLTHTSGIKNPGLIEKITNSRSNVSLSEFGEEIWNSNYTKPDSVFFEYSDINFDLLGYLLQKSANIPFESYLKDNILIPAGMVNSDFATEWPENNNSMTGYQETFVWKRIEPKKLEFDRLPSPSSGLITSIEEMNLFLIHLLRGDMGIFKNELKWLNPTKIGAPMGFQEIRIDDESWLGHFGGQAGYSSLLLFSPQKKTGLILFSNARDTKGFRKNIMSQILQVLPASN